MRTLLKITLSILSLYIIISLFLDSTITIEQSIEVKSPINKVFMKVANTKEWQNWEYWATIDSTIKNKYQGPVYGDNARRKWSSEKSGNGMMTFKNVVLNQHIEYDLSFTKPFEFQSSGILKFEQISGITKVNWIHTEELPFLLKAFSFYAKKMTIKAFKESLNNLKMLCEEEQDVYNITMQQKNAFEYYSEKSNCKVSEIGKTLEQLYGKISQQISQDQAKFFGRPICFYHNFSADSVKLEAALPVFGSRTTDATTHNTSTVIKATYVGSYDKTQPVYDALDEFVAYNQLKVEPTHYQIFITDPGEVDNSSNWVTEIYYTLSTTN